MKRKVKNRSFIISIVCFLFLVNANAQEEEYLPEYAKYKDLTTKYWVNTYGNIRISNKLFWVAQTHFRFEESEKTPFVGQIGQVYNRHALGYIYSKKINFALGGVLRVNFNTDESDFEGKNSVPEWRIWHQYQFAIPFGRSVAYHRLRVEHRWSKGFEEESEYIFRNRWRYMFRLKIPINKSKVAPNVFYVSPETELIMQSGKEVVASPLEDLRLTTTFGYIFSPQLTVASGIMYNMGQDLSNGGEWKQGWTLRTHIYFSPDFRKQKSKQPSVHFRD